MHTYGAISLNSPDKSSFIWPHIREPAENPGGKPDDIRVPRQQPAAKLEAKLTGTLEGVL
jgi:hypothetical protein